MTKKLSSDYVCPGCRQTISEISIDNFLDIIAPGYDVDKYIAFLCKKSGRYMSCGMKRELRKLINSRRL